MEVKNPTTYEQQIQILKNRGCVINNDEFAINVLSKINYYRLTAYFLPFLHGEEYIPGTTFERVYYLHEFDKKLRNIIFIILEDIELALRMQLAYYHSHKYGALGYKDSRNFNNLHNARRFEDHLKRAIKNNENQLFVKHHIKKYDGNFPLWVIIELFSFGELSIFYSDFHVSDQKEIANTLYQTNYNNLSSWLKCMTDLRNYCAHYSRLYYNIFPATPKTPKGYNYTLSNKIFDYILVLKFLYKNIGEWNVSFLTPFNALIEEYFEYIDCKHMNFPYNGLDLLNH